MAKKTKTEVTTKSPTRQMWRRSVVVLVILVGVCFSTLIGKLAVLQIVETDEWQKRAVSQQMSDSIISAKRGAIYDTNMKKLVESSDVWTVIMSPSVFHTNRPMEPSIRTACSITEAKVFG